MLTLFATIVEVITLATWWLRAQITVVSRTISAPNLILRAALVARIMMVAILARIMMVTIIALVAFMFITFTLAKALHNLDDIG
jgi:hypothetical protein